MLPNGFEIVEEGNKLYIKFDDVYIVTDASGTKKHVRGIDDKSRQRMSNWAWQYADGQHREYRRAWPGENVR